MRVIKDFFESVLKADLYAVVRENEVPGGHLDAVVRENDVLLDKFISQIKNFFTGFELSHSCFIAVFGILEKVIQVAHDSASPFNPKKNITL